MRVQVASELAQALRFQAPGPAPTAPALQRSSAGARAPLDVPPRRAAQPEDDRSLSAPPHAQGTSPQHGSAEASRSSTPQPAHGLVHPPHQPPSGGASTSSAEASRSSTPQPAQRGLHQLDSMEPGGSSGEASRSSTPQALQAATHQPGSGRASRAGSGGSTPGWEPSADTELGASRAVSRLPSQDHGEHHQEHTRRLSDQLPPQPPAGNLAGIETSAANPAAAGAADAIDLSALNAPGFRLGAEQGAGLLQGEGGGGRAQAQGRRTAEPGAPRQGWLQGLPDRLPDSKGIFARVQQLRLARRTQA